MGDSFTYKEFITGYIALPVFVIMYIGFKLYHRTKTIKPEEVDLDTYRDVVDTEEQQFADAAAEKEALRQAQGNPKDKEWYYDTFIGWLF